MGQRRSPALAVPRAQGLPCPPGGAQPLPGHTHTQDPQLAKGTCGPQRTGVVAWASRTVRGTSQRRLLKSLPTRASWGPHGVAAGTPHQLRKSSLWLPAPLRPSSHPLGLFSHPHKVDITDFCVEGKQELSPRGAPPRVPMELSLAWWAGVGHAWEGRLQLAVLYRTQPGLGCSRRARLSLAGQGPPAPLHGGAALADRVSRGPGSWRPPGGLDPGASWCGSRSAHQHSRKPGRRGDCCPAGTRVQAQPLLSSPLLAHPRDTPSSAERGKARGLLHVQAPPHTHPLRSP